MEIREALTFDDVLLEPAESAVLPTETDTTTRLTRSIELGIPLMSAAMDTVFRSHGTGPHPHPTTPSLRCRGRAKRESAKHSGCARALGGGVGRRRVLAKRKCPSRRLSLGYAGPI